MKKNNKLLQEAVARMYLFTKATAQQTADYYGVSIRSVYNWAKAYQVTPDDVKKANYE